jgi:hypothetical protein
LDEEKRMEKMMNMLECVVSMVEYYIEEKKEKVKERGGEEEKKRKKERKIRKKGKVWVEESGRM